MIIYQIHIMSIKGKNLNGAGANLQLSFDVGHSSIGWAVLDDQGPNLLGCGAVIFPADDCLASQRRAFRRQRRHIRATRLRIARMKRLFAHLGVLTNEQLDAVTSSSPWLLAARVLRGGKKLTWADLWDVLRWYAHNRGYDGNKGWSRQQTAVDAEDTEKEQKAHELLDAFRAKYGREGTMAEVFCDRLRLDPLAAKTSSQIRFRDLGAAFPREGVEAEVERILRAQRVEEKIIEALMRDHTAVAGPDYRLPARYGQRVNGSRTPGGLLFGQLVPRFENRIIATCPVQFQREYDRVFAETGDAKKATHEAEKLAKVPGIGCVEFHRFRWAMQLANVTVATSDARRTRRLSQEERIAVNAEMARLGALTPKQFKDLVRAQTKTDKDNLDRLLALPDADKSLVLDPARKLVTSGVLGVLWPHLAENLQKHTLTNLRRGQSVTVRSLLEKCRAAQSAFDHWWDGEAMKTPRKTKKNPAPEARTRDQILNDRHSLGPMNGRAAHSRKVMDEVWKFVLSSDGHPMDPGAPLFRSEAIRLAQLERAIDEQTNNHLVRHRLKLLERLHADLLKEYASGNKSRVDRITIEVNRSLKELSGKSAQEQAKEQGQQTSHFRAVERKLAAAYEGLGVKLGPGLIRKGRIAEDLGWKCPYTGAGYDELDLLHRRVDKDHIIPRNQRMSDSLDSLVVTFSEINKLKGNRTAVQFIAEFQSQPVPGLPNIMIKPLTNYLKDVDALDTFKGHGDDQRRKKNRQRLMRLRDYVEKEFTPGDLTKTSQLVRLAAEALQRAYLNEKVKPTIVSLPGSVTGAVRKSWNLAGCLEAANKNVMNAEDLDENGKPRVHRKTELRGITHLHHALDASTLAFTSHLLPCDGGTWKREIVELLAKRRCNPAEQSLLRQMLCWKIAFTKEGQPVLGEISDELREQLRTRLTERRVVQHLPASMADMMSDQTVWRLFDPADSHPNTKRLARWLAEAGVSVPTPESKTALIITRKRKSAPKPGEKEESAGSKVFHEGKIWRWVYDLKAKDALLGFAPSGNPTESKLKPFKAVKVLGDNFGIALDPEPTLIRPLHVWRQLQTLKAANGGKWPRVLRRGMLIRVLRAKSEKVNYSGVWMVRGVYFKQKGGFMLDLSPADFIEYRRIKGAFETVSVATLIKCGLEVLRSPLCGLPLKP
jgi:CRISPR-associated endonuclease Csn1